VAKPRPAHESLESDDNGAESSHKEGEDYNAFTCKSSYNEEENYNAFIPTTRRAMMSLPQPA
jgi:hypothetical protein